MFLRYYLSVDDLDLEGLFEILLVNNFSLGSGFDQEFSDRSHNDIFVEHLCLGFEKLS